MAAIDINGMSALAFGIIKIYIRFIIFRQIQEDREYVTMTSSDTSRYLSDRINAIHEEGYEIRHATSDEWGYVLLIFRKIPRPEQSEPPVGTTAAN